MASVPARQPSQPQRQSHEQTSDQSQSAPSPIRTRSATSEDSQTLFLNSPPKEATSPEQTESAQPQRANLSADDDPSVKKCWICFADSTEDTPTTSPWRSPCPCALVAHEECLLDWIADTESPSNATRRGTRSISAPRIECPQCKAELKLARPRNLVVDAVRAMERAAERSIVPGAVTVVGGMLYQGSMMWGIHSIYAVFGAEDGFRILRPMFLNAVRPPLEAFAAEPPKEIARRVLGLFVDHLVHWRLYIGLPLITPILILSRTSFADSVLPVLPILFFATQTHARDEAALDFTHWPPSAGLAFATLPYIRQAYNAYYQRVWAERERRWMREIQPRSGGQNETNGDGEDEDVAPHAPAARDDGNVFEVRIDAGMWEEWDGGDGDEDPGAPAPQIPQPGDPNMAMPPLEQARVQAPGQAEPPPNIADNRAAEQAANLQQQPAAPQPAGPGNAAAPRGGVGNERRLSFSPTAIAETVLGAILCPTICALSGDLLKFVLPASWTTPLTMSGGRGRIPAGGLLREKWGRSLLGGCAFVVLKDALMLYVRWRMCVMHRKRRVLDYDGKKVRR